MQNETESLRWEQEWSRRLPADQPWVLRLDGRGFHRWTRGLERPFDDGLRNAMVQAAEAVMRDAGALHAYTQSDEITLVFAHAGERDRAFGGKLQKLVSLAAAQTTTSFNDAIGREHPAHAAKAGPALFDARVFAVPSNNGALQALQDRSRDCWVNAVQSVGQSVFGHKWMLSRPVSEVETALAEAGKGMETWPGRHTGGVALQRTRVRRRFTAEELEKLPPKHDARLNPELEVDRMTIVTVQRPDYRRDGATAANVFAEQPDDQAGRTSGPNNACQPAMTEREAKDFGKAAE